ncbi:MAG TPA: hypothetical protein PKW35_24905, partial [Nannocystaceae bacterium]|nr:hypothetical protein [Nannocystaceae bacterium]
SAGRRRALRRCSTVDAGVRARALHRRLVRGGTNTERLVSPDGYRPRPCERLRLRLAPESTAISGERRATSGSVIRGIWSGPITVGVIVMAPRRRPTVIGLPAHAATSRSRVSTAMSTEQPCRAYTPATKSGHVGRFIAWIAVCASRTSAASGAAGSSPSSRPLRRLPWRGRAPTS